MRIITRWDKMKPWLAVLGFAVSLSVLLIGVVGFTATTQGSIEQLVSFSLAGGGGDDDLVETIYDALFLLCQQSNGGQSPGNASDLQIPFTINCTDVAGLDLDGFRAYIADRLEDLLWVGELSIAEVLGGDGEDGLQLLEEFISSYLADDSGQYDPVTCIHNDITYYCRLFPGATLSADLAGGGLPFTMDCDEVSGLDIDGFRDYLAMNIATSLWQGELTIPDVLGGEDGDGLETLEEFIASYLSGDPYQLSLLYLEMAVTCFFFPDASVSQTVTGEELPFTIHCGEIDGLDEQGFIQWFIETLAYKLWTGELSVAEVLEDEGGYEQLEDFVASCLAEDAGWDSPLFDAYDDFREHLIGELAADLWNGNITLAEALGGDGDGRSMLRDFITSYLTPEPGGEDVLAAAFDGLTMYCEFLPGGSLGPGTGVGELPFNMSCADVAMLDLEGFRGYFIELVAGMLWRGELTITDVMGEDAKDMEGSFTMLTVSGNTTFLLLILAGVPLSLGTGALMLYTTSARRWWLRLGVVFGALGGTGLLLSTVLFFLLPVSESGGDGMYEISAADVLALPAYATFAVVSVMGLILLVVYRVQDSGMRRGGRRWNY